MMLENICSPNMCNVLKVVRNVCDVISTESVSEMNYNTSAAVTECKHFMKVTADTFESNLYLEVDQTLVLPEKFRSYEMSSSLTCCLITGEISRVADEKIVLPSTP